MARHGKSKTASHGFTLIEVLVALTVLGLGGLAVLQYASETQDVLIEIKQMEVMANLATEKIVEIERRGLSFSTSMQGEFEDYPDYTWSLSTTPLRDGGWYKATLTIQREDTGRTVIVERIFREII